MTWNMLGTIFDGVRLRRLGCGVGIYAVSTVRVAPVPAGSGDLKLFVAEVGDEIEGAAECGGVAVQNVLAGDVTAFKLGGPGYRRDRSDAHLLLWHPRLACASRRVASRRMSGHASVALCACLGLGQHASHQGYLDLLGYFRPRRVDVLAPLLGVMREDLVIADALAFAQINRAGRLANPRWRRLRHRARLQPANEAHRFRHKHVLARPECHNGCIIFDHEGAP